MNSIDIQIGIDDIGDNLANKAVVVRTALENIKEGIFGEKLEYSTTISGILYNLTFEKRGSLCYVSGTIKNINSFISGVSLTIPNAIYYSLVDTYLDFTRWSNGYNNSCLVSDDNITFISSMGVGHEVYINGFYKILE